jgi:hypothetical protein
VESFFRPWTCKGEKESSWTNSLREIVENTNPKNDIAKAFCYIVERRGCEISLCPWGLFTLSRCSRIVADGHKQKPKHE